MARSDLHFRLRIPDDLKGKIEASAVITRRSMTAEIVARLNASFTTEPSIDAVLSEIKALRAELSAMLEGK